ncbi:DUF3560 domain-containing protein [Actinopolymorpha pittospori]|uniref:DUF3560 domain-containing protein n=1 Tax=Actinopolymorpha pittospori TaxID=648752 RepID=UPI00178AFCED
MRRSRRGGRRGSRTGPSGAEREQARADARHAAYRRIADHIPFGQPILVGHDSQRRAERDAERIRSHIGASIEHQERADRVWAAARTAAAAPGSRHNSVTVANRIRAARG